MDTTPATEVATELLAICSQLLEITSELGWDQPARLALLTEPDSSTGVAATFRIGDDHGLVMGFPRTIEGHPCPSLAELGAQPDAAGAVLVTEGWATVDALASTAEDGGFPLEHAAPDGRVEVRTAIGVHRNGTRVQITQTRRGLAHECTGVSGRVPDALAMTVGIDADLTRVRLEDLLRRAWLTIAAINAARQLGEIRIHADSIEEAVGQFRDLIARRGVARLDEDLASSPFTRLARLLARSIDTDPASTWRRLATRLRSETNDSQPILGWALAAAVEPQLLERWNAISERRARRWAGPGMLAHITDAGYSTWEDIDVLFGETHPRTRTYLELLPDIDDIVSDLAGNARQA